MTVIDGPRARNTDPETSHAAARSVTGVTERQRALLALFRHFGPMTDVEIAENYPASFPKQSPSGLRTRRAELVEQGLVRWDGFTRTLPSGREARVWLVGS